ncbi:MAG: glycosyltransferase family 4 protein [Victivallales bacterium]|jgi:glycosyltransferase involved in cell wall biosynthesis
MTVFYILDSFPSLSENFILREIVALKKSGVNIRICALNKPAEGAVHPDALPLLEDVIYVNDLTFKCKSAAVAGNFFRHPALFAKLAASLIHDMFFSFRFMCQRMRGAINAMAIADFANIKPDHVHAHFAYVAADVASVLAELGGCKWSVSAHAWDIFTQSREIINRRVDGADRIFACSRHGKSVLENLSAGRYQEDRTVLMYHGVDTSEFEIEGKADHIIAVGRLEEKKGFEILLQACRILAGQNIIPHCIIVGDAPQREMLVAEIRDLGLTNVELSGSMGFDRVKILMAESAMLVHPGRITENGDHDGIPNVLLEAMALEKPVIAASVGGIAELVVDGVNGILIKPDDPVQLAGAIKALLADKVRAEMMGKAAREHIKRHFEISETVQPLVKYFLSSR